MMKPMKRFITLFAVFLALLSSQAAAHGSEESFEATVGKLFIDIGYDVAFSVVTDTLLDVSLSNVKGGAVPYTSVLLSFESGAVIQWKKTVQRPEFGKAIVSVLPEKSGHWNFKAVFMNDADSVADAVFPVEIAPAPVASEDLSPMYALWVVMTALCVLTYAIYFRRTSKP